MKIFKLKNVLGGRKYITSFFFVCCRHAANAAILWERLLPFFVPFIQFIHSERDFVDLSTKGTEGGGVKHENKMAIFES